MLDAIGLDWPTTEIVWNPYNPLKQNPDLPPEIVFIGKDNGAEKPFNPSNKISEGLQEVVLMFAGMLRPKGGPGPEFTPILSTSDKGGIVSFSEITRQSFMGVNYNPNHRRFTSGKGYTVAAELIGDEPGERQGERREEKAGKIHAIAIADLDLISEQFFQLRRQKIEDLDLDNVTFVLNCVDVLAGDDAFVALRKRGSNTGPSKHSKPKPRHSWSLPETNQGS